MVFAAALEASHVEGKFMSACKYARCDRRGLSILEFLGCFIAVAGGVVLGSMYLGVDVQQAAVGLLQRTQAIEKPAEPAPTAAGQPVVHEVSAAVAAPPSPPAPAAIASPVTAPAVQPAFADGISLTPEQREALTRAYWDAINQCIQTETGARHMANQATGEWELYDYLSRRSAGHQTAADCIAKLNLRGVDAHIAAYAERVQDWHEAGATLFARAKDLLTDAPTAQLSGPFAQSWQSAATQHQMEERLLKEKHQAVQSYLDHADHQAEADRQ